MDLNTPVEIAEAGKDETSRETLARAFEAHTADSSPDAPAKTETPAAPDKKEDTTAVPPKEPEGTPEKVEGKAKEVKKEEPPADGLRAPESWKPAIKDKHWKTLPPEVQSEVFRRERQVEQVLKDSAEARRGNAAMGELVGSFRDVFDYERELPLKTLQNLLQINRTLRFGNPAAKAQVAAHVIMGYDVDVALLDEALSLTLKDKPRRTEQDASTAAMREMLQRELGPIRDMMGGVQRSRQAAVDKEDAEISSNVNAFADDPKNVYFDVVKDDMADLMELAAQRGQKLNLSDAYNRAILAHSELGPKVTRERMESTAKELSAKARKSAGLSDFSVTGSPSGGAAAGAGDGDVRSAVMAAISHHQGS